MTPSPITPGDSFAAVVAELRKHHVDELFDVHDFADRIERLDAENTVEMRSAMETNARQCEQLRVLKREHELLRAKLAACESEPMQPVVNAADGCVRFRPNILVRYLLDFGGLDLNKLAMVDCPQHDREQFAQLIGYSMSGYAELSYVSDAAYERACTAAKALASRAAGEGS